MSSSSLVTMHPLPPQQSPRGAYGDHAQDFVIIHRARFMEKGGYEERPLQASLSQRALQLFLCPRYPLSYQVMLEHSSYRIVTPGSSELPDDSSSHVSDGDASCPQHSGNKDYWGHYANSLSIVTIDNIGSFPE